ncbi:hypothetical protein MAR_018908 [Mya arenaria]|uniref:Uncharacterized protein n=1 Tax=Mya arenaria TaxID=6604 RepID=A0ABY7EG02_MYAAR|nr:hypothetical protein MAR_018903 [Mya arenaria]WAR08950.1 hypothetical protein MAR_018908 [Mya arenaria]
MQWHNAGGPQIEGNILTDKKRNVLVMHMMRRQTLTLYGDGDLQALYYHFETPLVHAGCDLLYVSRNQHVRGKYPLNVWRRVSKEDIERGENKKHLLIIHLTGLAFTHLATLLASKPFL